MHRFGWIVWLGMFWLLAGCPSQPPPSSCGEGGEACVNDGTPNESSTEFPPEEIPETPIPPQRCDKTCRVDQLCYAGNCICPAGQLDCDGRCIDPNNNANHCGQCKRVCGNQILCAHGDCLPKCPDSTPTVCDGGCIDLNTHALHCGACGNQCRIGEFCKAGTCACPTGMLRCQGICYDLRTTPFHCGSCLNLCKSGEVCAEGQCVTQCPNSTPTVCFGGCVNTQRDTYHCGECGQSCPNGQICRAGVCRCPDGMELCDGACVDTQASYLHCGGCGNACPSGQRCAAGSCTLSCPSATPTACFGGCIDLQNNPLHCGICGNRCSPGQSCIQGNCICPQGLTHCNNQCVNTFQDPLHCGACNKTCPTAHACVDGKCLPLADCSASQFTLCGSVCVNTKNNTDHCGGCGVQCPAFHACQESSCQLRQTSCTKNTDCPTSLVCVAGTCRSNTKTCPPDLPNCQFCTRKEECGIGFVCKVGEDVCRPGCANDLDCPEPGKPNCDFVAQLCKACVTTRDCKLDKPGMLCLNGVCSDCTVDAPCKAEYGSESVCVSGKCNTTKCATNANCAGKCSGTGDCLCLNGICGFCGRNEDCGTGKLCAAQKCASGCTKDTDCGSPQLVCLGGQCLNSIVLQAGASQWSDGTVGTDCAEYRFPSKAGYAAATKDGLYNIKPPLSTLAFPVYCNMTYAGGGWTLVLKADGAKTDFAYTSAHWTDDQPFADGGGTPNPDYNRIQAKLESYWTVPVSEILLQMQEAGSDKVRSAIVHIEGTSLRGVINKPNNTKFGSEVGQTVWRSLVKESSLDQFCLGEGVNLRTSGGDVDGVRLGSWASSSGVCRRTSAVGFGLARASSPTIGNVAGALADAGSKTTAAFGYVLVRNLPVRAALIDDTEAKAPAMGGALSSCLDYHLPPYSAVADGAYWIKPPAQNVRKKAYCLMSRLGGGWTLAMKVDGNQTTFLYNAALWEDKTYLGENNLLWASDAEAKFESFGTLGFSQIALAFRSPPTAPARDDRFVVLHRSATSLHAVFSTKAYSSFDYPLGRATWKSVIPDSGLGKDCSTEGFNLVSRLGITMRIGILAASVASNCTTPEGWGSRLGVGGKGMTNCTANPNSSAGNDAPNNCNPDLAANVSSFVFVLVR